MRHQDRFRYVEFCRGIARRNELIPFTELGRSIRAALREDPECELYRSVQLYPEEAMDWVKERGSLSGYSGETWADHVYIDVDSEKDLAVALDSAQRIVGRLLTTFFVDHNVLKIAFSGKKGFHIYMPQGLIGYGPHTLLHKQMGMFVAEVAGANLYDKVIYTPGRLIRLNGSRHRKSGLFKYLMPVRDLVGGSIEQILETAKNPPAPPSYDDDVEINSDLAALWPSADKVERHRPAPGSSKALPIFGDQGAVEIRTDQRMCIQTLLNRDVRDGQGRNEHLLRITSHFANLGTPPDVVMAIADSWNRKQTEPQPDEKVHSTVKSAVDHKYYYGCSDTLLASVCDKRCFKYKDEVAVQKVEPSKFKNIFELSKEYLRIYTEKRFVTFGIRELDEQCRGIAPGEVGVLVAKSGVGKTTFMMNMARNVVQATGLPVLMLEQELHDFLMTEKMVSMATSRSAAQLEQAVLLGIEQKDMSLFDELLKKTDERFKNVFVCTDDRLDTDTKIELVKAFAAIHGRPALVFEDFLGRGREFGRTPYEIASKLAQGLKTIAKACDVPYFCLAQVARGSNPAEDSSTPLTMGSARDSGQIEENADFVFGMYRPNFGTLNQDTTVRIQILKSRRGNENHQFSLDWDRTHGIYTSIQEREVSAAFLHDPELARTRVQPLEDENEPA